MRKQVTTSDIAKKLGLSRGTVSKALNGRESVDERTRLLVQKTAAEMGYRKLASEQLSKVTSSDNNISLMIRETRFGDLYWSCFIKSFEKEATRRKFRFTMSVISREDEELLRLPRRFDSDPPTGIITVGPFSKEYYLKVKSSKIPVIYVDTAPDIADSDILGDTLFMCNEEYVYEMTTHLIAKGHKRLGFIGGNSPCRSFQKRWEGFRKALTDNNIPLRKDLVFGIKKHEPIDNVNAWLASLKEFPTVFVCNNDMSALIVKSALKEFGLEVPRDIAMCGFDNDPSIPLLFPDLTTVDSQVEYVGKRAMQELFWRIANPDAPFEVVKITSEVYYRNSTEGYIFQA